MDSPIEGFPLQGSAQDTARVAARIVTGVGFLGAGAMLHARGHVRGLTTATSIWPVAAIGMALGTGTFFLAVFATILSMMSLILLAPVSHRLEHRAEMRRIVAQGSQKRAAGEDRREASEAKFLD